jgi:hypothetical protein
MPLGLWTMTQTDPIVTPPPPDQKTLARVITVSATTPAVLDPATQAYLTSRGTTYTAYTLSQIVQPNPPADALKYIGLTAGKQTPYTFAVASDGTTLAAAPTPATPAAFMAFLGQPQPTATAPPADIRTQPPCPAGYNCQPQQPFTFRGRR